MCYIVTWVALFAVTVANSSPDKASCSLQYETDISEMHVADQVRKLLASIHWVSHGDETTLNLQTATVTKAVMCDLRSVLDSWSWLPKWWRSLRSWTDRTVTCVKSYKMAASVIPSAGGALLLCTLLHSTALTAGQAAVGFPELEPEFLAPLENHTVTQGREVYFTCVVNHLSSYKVAWIKSDSKAILAIHTHMVAQNPRLSVTHNGHNTWKLHVANVQKNDSGTYMCQINTDPMRSQMGNLEVVIPPDILNDNESAEGGVAVEGGSVRLRCHATGVPEPTVTWRREDTRNIVLRHEGGREKQAVRFFNGDTILLANIQRSDMGSYLCIASNGVPPSVSKRFMVKVHFHPLIRVSNQLVAAPIASDVQVQCYVEASPRAMNHWTRDSGEKLMPNDKYTMDETPLNDYSFLMNLTIRSLDKKDFGGYICMSSNALGKAEGVVRLQELHLPVQTTSTAAPPRYVDTKPRKPLHKDKGKKYVKPKGGRKNLGELGDNSDEEVEITTIAIPDLKRASPETTNPSSSRPPPWVSRPNAAPAEGALAGLLILTVAAALN